MNSAVKDLAIYVPMYCVYSYSNSVPVVKETFATQTMAFLATLQGQNAFPVRAMEFRNLMQDETVTKRERAYIARRVKPATLKWRP